MHLEIVLSQNKKIWEKSGKRRRKFNFFVLFSMNDFSPIHPKPLVDRFYFNFINIMHRIRSLTSRNEQHVRVCLTLAKGDKSAGLCVKRIILHVTGWWRCDCVRYGLFPPPVPVVIWRPPRVLCNSPAHRSQPLWEQRRERRWRDASHGGRGGKRRDE